MPLKYFIKRHNLYSTPEEIRKVAYELYVKSGCIPGRDLDNWLEAERIVLERYGLISKEGSQETSPSSACENQPKTKVRCRKKTEERSATQGKGRGKKKG